MDYAVLRGVSTSTLRRYIKAKKIRYKIENGRYLLLADAGVAAPKTAMMATAAPRPSWDGTSASSLDMSVYSRVRELEEQLTQAQEQISELKMLVAIYEEKLSG
ncbi:MAG: hypothetical protein HY075_14960 [Deltaproteobacteria bacterium]|nr:hypothetical protein [Deltaproteobacteria bacterium]